ncbi:hypothetical protein D3C73_1411850 [compost metagenome]
MDDITDIRLVDPHPKSVGGDHDADIVIEKTFLALRPLLVAHPCMVTSGGDAGSLQPLIQIIHLFAGGGIDDARLMGVLCRIIQHELAFVLSAQH